MFNSRKFMRYNGGAVRRRRRGTMSVPRSARSARILRRQMMYGSGLRPETDLSGSTDFLGYIQQLGPLPANRCIDYVYAQDALRNPKLPKSEKTEAKSSLDNIKEQISMLVDDDEKKAARRQLLITRKVADGTLWKSAARKTYTYPEDTYKLWKDQNWSNMQSWNEFRRTVPGKQLKKERFNGNDAATELLSLAPGDVMQLALQDAEEEDMMEE